MHSLTVVHLVHHIHLLLIGLAGSTLQISPLIVTLAPATSSTLVSMRRLSLMA
jgi:hypothetical protein